MENHKKSSLICVFRVQFAMKVFVVKILLSLLFIVLVTSDIVTESRLHKEYKNDEDDHNYSGTTSSQKHRNQEGTVTGEVDHELSTKNSTNKDYDQDDTEVRAVVPQMVFNNPNQQCYTQFFAGGQQPTGLRTGQNLQSIKYICQMVNQQTYYGTMFDESRGIAVFSAYTLTQANANFPNRPRPGQWTQTRGIMPQGSDAIYLNQQFDKGHLVPGAIYRNTPDSLRSTFVYTNAVPQRPAFNRGQWSQFERRIRMYAQQCTQGPQPGTLYLLTGTAFGHIQINPQGMNPVQVNQLGPAGNNPAIDIPNSMWTAGCCVHPISIESFAVIGNNLQNRNLILTQQIPVARLQDILRDDVNYLNIGGLNVDLFPGNGACSNLNNNLINLPRGIGR